MIYQSFDIATSILVGTFIAFITGYAFANITFCISRPQKTMEQVVSEHVVNVLHRQGALAAISAGLQAMNHPDADLFANVISVVYANTADIIINEWIIRAVLILSADINNRIDKISLTKNIDIPSYIDDNYESADDSDSESDDAEENTNEINSEEQSDSAVNTSQSNDGTEGEEDDSDAEEEQTSGSSSPVRVKRALTHYSEASSASSNENTGTPATPPSSESDEPVEAATNGESLPSESINSTSESSTASVEDSGKEGITSENS